MTQQYPVSQYPPPNQYVMPSQYCMPSPSYGYGQPPGYGYQYLSGIGQGYGFGAQPSFYSPCQNPMGFNPFGFSYEQAANPYYSMMSMMSMGSPMGFGNLFRQQAMLPSY